MNMFGQDNPEFELFRDLELICSPTALSTNLNLRDYIPKNILRGEQEKQLR